MGFSNRNSRIYSSFSRKANNFPNLNLSIEESHQEENLEKAIVKGSIKEKSSRVFLERDLPDLQKSIRRALKNFSSSNRLKETHDYILH